MDALAVLKASWAAACLLAPGVVLAGALGLAREPLERLVVGAALGRLLLALLAVALSGTAALRWLPLWGVPWIAIGLLAASRAARGRPRPRTIHLHPLAVVAAAGFVVACIGGRSGLPDAAGTLRFFGHHTTVDPLVYTAVAAQLAERGYPISHPLVAGLPNLGHALFFGELVGLRFAGGLDPLDVAFRVRPLLDVATLGLAALALARRLGASPLGGALAGVLMLLGGGISQLAYAVLHFFEWPLQQVEAWAFGTPFLLPVNPIAPALQTAFAALLALAVVRPTRAIASGHPLAVAPERGLLAAGVAGLLAAAVFEIKLFLWPPLVAGLLLAAVWAPDREARRRLALATGVAVVAALPALAEKLAIDAQLGSRAVVGPELCLGCVPRAVAEWSFARRAPDWERLGRSGGGLDPADLAGAAGAAALVFALVLGARLFALPQLLRGAMGLRESGSAAHPAALARALYRVLLGAAASGLALAFVTTTPPHALNALQLAWAASFPLWVVLGIVLGRWLHTRRRLRAAAVLALALPGGLFWIVDQGALSPVHAQLDFDEQQLMATLAAESQPGDLVLEPSLLTGPASVSPVAWRAGRPVFLSHDGASRYLPDDELARRRRLLEQAFDPTDPEAAGTAIRASRARFVYAPAARPLPPRGIPTLTPIRTNAAGTLFRVTPP